MTKHKQQYIKKLIYELIIAVTIGLIAGLIYDYGLIANLVIGGTVALIVILIIGLIEAINSESKGDKNDN